jgi:outer membrane protein OmpA-like peptidoglycan-associated protein
MMKTAILIVTATLVATVGWTEEAPRTSTHEAIGFGGGAAIGGAAGGPIGLVVGAALGAWLGDRFEAERSAHLDYERRWGQARDEVAALNGLVQNSEQQVALLETRLRQEAHAMRDTVREALDVRVLFKTNESVLAQETEERLARLAELLARMDGMLIRVEGYADPRGEEEYNEQLSAARAVAVRDMLIRSGVPANRISVDAHGERQSSATDGDVDALALERRVQLTLIPADRARRIAQK